METSPHTEFVSLRVAATKLGLSQSWLKSMVEAGSVPAIRIGRKILVHFEDVEQALRQLAKQTPAAEPEGGEA